MMPNFKSLKNIDVVPDPTDILILNAGFENRSFYAISRLPANFSKSVLMCQIDGTGDETADAIRNTELAKATIFHDLLLSTVSPVDIADNFTEKLNSTIRETQSDLKITVDVTCFTHEILLIILKVIELEYPKADLNFFYTQPEKYDAENSPEKKWLSHGVKEVRSILGYSGISTPSKKTHLVVLAGFETERALSVINAIEPNTISIGQGDDTSLDDEVSRTNGLAVSEIVDRLRNNEISRFEFPPYDFLGTAKSLESLSLSGEENIVVAPMNTKISTIGAALFAKKNKRVQLVYGLAELYNVKNYSFSQARSYWFSAVSL